MLMLVLLSLEFLCMVVAKEPVLLQDLTQDHDKRHLDAGLPPVVTFNLRRETGNVKLTLEESRHVDFNAPVFEGREDETGEIRLVRQATLPITGIKYYKDKGNMGVFSVECHVSSEGPCTRKLTGNFNIDGRNFDIEPAPASAANVSQRGVENVDSFGTLHLLHENEATDIFKRTSFIHDVIYDAGTAADDDELTNKGVLEDDLDGVGKDEDTRQISSVADSNQYVVEILVVLDYELWKRYYDTTSASGTMTRGEATDLRLRKHFSLIIMGVSLRYEEIEDPELKIFCTISGFIIYKTRDNSNPLPPGREVLINGKWHADSDEYIVGLTTTGWIAALKKRNNLPATDHIMIFTGYVLYDQETGDDATAGVAYLGGVCYPTRVSLNEAAGFFFTTSVATHELGHNLGADHDGEDTAWQCNTPGDHIMSPYLAHFDESTIYSVNPWRFSKCSVEAFKNFMKMLDSNRKNCLKNPANKAAHDEFTKHASQLPGELHSGDEQCQLIHGEHSRLCRQTDLANICLVMKCLTPDGLCMSYAAARGTACKGSNANKSYWCIDGACIEKKLPDPDPSSPNNPPNDDEEKCVDEGLSSYSCATLRSWYEKLSDFCAEVYAKYCCKTCSLLKSDACVDYGIGGYTCQEVMANPTYFTHYHPGFCEKWGTECCEACSNQAEATTPSAPAATDSPHSDRCLYCPGDTGYDGLSCEELRQILGGKSQMCQFYTQECCKTCASICRANKKGIRIFRQTFSCEHVLKNYFYGHINAFCRVYAKPCCKTCTKA